MLTQSKAIIHAATMLPSSLVFSVNIPLHGYLNFLLGPISGNSSSRLGKTP